MQTEFWLDLWRNGHTGFHRDAPMPLLVEHWHSLELTAHSRVLVPLAGKSLDMLWLADQGHRVLGVELSPLAVQQFLDDHGLKADVRESEQGIHYVAGDIEIIQGDIFALSDATLAACDAIYDRAAMIALPSDMRERYAHQIYGRLPAHCRGLLIALDYPQSEMSGPPFSVTRETVDNILLPSWRIKELERVNAPDPESHFREAGLSSLLTTVYRLNRIA